MTIPKDIIQEQPGVFDWAILSGYRGSIAHGMYVPSNDPDSIDDIDVMAVCVSEKDQYIGLGHYLIKSRFEQDIWKEAEWDVTTFEIRKFVYLLLK